MIDDEDVYAAMESRDQRFDGWFFVAVVTTGIYCRPSCPAVMPKRENIRVFSTVAAAQAGGFRACKRCRPDAAPGSPEWNHRFDLVARAMRLIADGVIDREGVSGLATRLGYSERHLNRRLLTDVGAGPQALARAQRAQTARTLLESTDLPVSDVAFAAGFASIRQFNATIREVFGTTPTRLRASRTAIAAPGAIVLRLEYRPPFDAAALLAFLGKRPAPGIEEYDGRTYRRSLSLPHGPGIIALTPAAGHVRSELRLADLRDLTAAVQRCRRILDLDADQSTIDRVLGNDPYLAPLVAAAPGLRIPGNPDATELAVRTVLDDVTPLIRAYGHSLAGPLGTITHTFPAPQTLIALTSHDLEALGYKPPAIRNLRSLTRALAENDIDVGSDRDHLEKQFAGTDPRIVPLIRMRVLGDPDIFLSGDAPDRWRPWRSYAQQHLWQGHVACGSTNVKDPRHGVARVSW
ncbi:DNA-3-methyladenine glycosylase 2 family protein [Spirillospora sp. NPDC048911]|uniref:DNA-3-methyladenine glycosylase 2 family protein n=1 Tax=Spirillospora sp. NPDC048911 TaxID=3364527 RepID=UPI003711508F